MSLNLAEGNFQTYSRITAAQDKGQRRDFVKVEICIGSSCHIRGSKDVIQKMMELVKQYNLEKTVDLAGSFCMGACSKGVSVRIDGDSIYHVVPEETEEFFQTEILGRLNQ